MKPGDHDNIGVDMDKNLAAVFENDQNVTKFEQVDTVT